MSISIQKFEVLRINACQDNHIRQNLELALAPAIEQAAITSRQLSAMAARHRAHHTHSNQHDTRRHWDDCAATFCYQTHIAIEAQSSERLAWLADVLFNAASLSSQPWYPQFLGGSVQTVKLATADGIAKQHITGASFDLGLPNPRYYRQLLTLACPDKATRVLVARSVSDGPEPPANTKLAYTVAPNGEVLHYENGRLHWHHICCTPGASIFTGRLDRWFINALRAIGLDRAERRTYREEAQRMRDWLSATSSELPS